MLGRFLVPALLTLVAVGPLAVPAAAQTEQTGVIEVRVVSEDGTALPGVRVRTAQPDGSYAREETTGEDGVVRAGFLPPGDYTVRAELDGFLPKTIQGIGVSATRVSPVTVELEAVSGEITEEVTVTAEAPLIDTTTTETGTIELRDRDIELLPITRTATGLIEFTPGARPNQVWGGSTDQANLYQLDGVTVNQPGFGGDFLLPNVDWLEEFQVKGLGTGAQYGDFQGGLVNMVTKSGGNTLEGGVRFNYQDESLNETNLNALEAGEEQDNRWETNFDLSGPLMRDRLFYFVSAQQVEATTNIVDSRTTTQSDQLTFLPIQEERTETKLLGKLTWMPTRKDTFHVLTGWDDVETDNRGLDSFTAPEAAQEQDSPSIFYNLSWLRPVARSGFLEVKGTGYSAEDDRFPRSRTLPAVQLLGGNRDLFENAVYTRERSLNNNALSANYDAYLELGETTHQLKVGAEYREGSWFERRNRNGNLTWRPEEGDAPFDPNDPATWGFISSDWGGDIRLDADVTNAAVYVQDDIDLTGWLSLSAGLRWGSWKGELTPGFGGGGTFTAVEDDAVAPRLGLVADLTRDGKTIAKLHWGRYYQNLFALMFDRVEGGNVFRDLEFWDWDGAGLPDPDRAYTEDEREDLFVFFDSIPTGEEVGPAEDYSQPFVDQWVVSLDRELDLGGDRWRVGATYVNREWKDILALVDKNLASNYTMLQNVRVFDFATGDPVLDQDGNPLVLPGIFISNRDIRQEGEAPGLTPGQIANLTFDQDFALTNVPEATRDMDQVQLTAERRGADWSLHASVVWTELEGNFFSVSGYDDPGGTGAGSFVNPNEQINFFGTLPNVSEWEGKLRLSGQLPWGFRGGAFLLYASGDAFAPVYEIDNRNHDFVTEDGELIDFRLFDDVSGEAILLEDRGSREHEDLTILDLSLDRPFALGPGELVVGATVFNVLDEDSVTAVKTLVNEQDPADPTTQFGAVRFRQSPRTIRLNVGYRW